MNIVVIVDFLGNNGIYYDYHLMTETCKKVNAD